MSGNRTVNWAGLTPTELVNELPVFIGGSGGVGKKGLTPQPNDTDGFGLKFLADDGTWKTVSGSGTFTKTTALFGDGVSLVFVIPHGIAGGDVIPYVKKVSDGSKANCSISNDATNVTITFVGTPPTLNEFKLVVVG